MLKVAVVLGFVNPFLEEFFWRSFIPLSLRGGHDNQDKYFAMILFANFFYTIYHLLVILYFVK